MSFILQPPVPTYTWATKPASYAAGQPVFISDAAVHGSHWHYAGSRWRPVNGQVVLATLDAESAPVGNSETITLQYLFPAGSLQVADRLRLYYTLNKSGTTDQAVLNLRIGTGGTTSDTLVLNQTNAIAATSRSSGQVVDFRVDSATTIRKMVNGSATASAGYSNQSNSANPAAVTISNVSNALYVSIGILSSSTNDTVTLVDAALQLLSPA